MRPEKQNKIADLIAGRILSGDYPPGGKLPSQNELAEEHHISRTCVHHALGLLAERGLITTQPGKGVFAKDKEGAVERRLRNVGLFIDERLFRVSGELDSFGMDIFLGIEDALRRRDINFTVRSFDINAEADAILGIVKRMAVDGLILGHYFPDEALKLLPLSGIPVVMAGRKTAVNGILSVSPNAYDYIYHTLSRLHGEGFRKICFLCSHMDAMAGEGLAAVESLKRALPDTAGVSVVDILAAATAPTENIHGDIYALMDKMVRENALPEVFVTDSDWTAFRILESLRKNGVPVPERVRIIGLLGLGVSEKADPPISTLAVDAFEIGQKSVELLVRFFDDRNTPPIEKIPMRFIERKSHEWKEK